MKTLDEWLDDYIAHALALGKSPLYLRTVRFQLVAFVRWLRVRLKINRPTAQRHEHLDSWLLHMAGHRTAKGMPLKPRSINKHVESIRGLLLWLSARQLIPAPLVAALRYIREPRTLPTSVLQHAQMKKLTGKIAPTDAMSLRDRAMLEFLYSTGVRAGELCGLDLTHVDLTNATAVVTGKGAQRVVPIGRTALRLLRRYLRRARPMLAASPTETALWVNAHGTRLRYHTLVRLVHRHSAGVDLPVIVTPHTFRRSCATELIRAGANLWHVKELLGHEKLETLQHYARLTILDLKETHARCHPSESRR